MDTDHTPKTLLASSIPELETNFETINMYFLCDEECAASGSCVSWVEPVLCVSLEEGSLSYARVAHDDDLTVDAMVVGVHWVGGPPRRRERELLYTDHHQDNRSHLPYMDLSVNRFGLAQLSFSKISAIPMFSSIVKSIIVTWLIFSTPVTLRGTQTQHPSLSGGDIQMKTSQACTRVTLRLLSQGTCATQHVRKDS